MPPVASRLMLESSSCASSRSFIELRVLVKPLDYAFLDSDCPIIYIDCASFKNVLKSIFLLMGFWGFGVLGF